MTDQYAISASQETEKGEAQGLAFAGAIGEKNTGSISTASLR